LLLNTGAARFVPARFDQAGYFSTPHRGRGLAAGDFDGDGDLDLAISHSNEPVALLRNDSTNGGHWLAVELIGIRMNRDAIGTRLVLHTSRGDQMRQVKGGGSYLSHSDRRPFWGVPADAEVLGLSVFWPSGAVQRLERVPLNRRLRIVEPRQGDAH
jgi:hypothetical protein